MAEVQNSTQAGETTARFIEFVQMQYQNACLFLGLIPNPQGGQPDVNLDLARMFIDQLAMIGEKTRGNLSADEAKILRNALSNLQLAYVEVAQGGEAAPAGAALSPADEPAEEPVSAAAPESSATPASAAISDDSRESKKRFTKSYGS